MYPTDIISVSDLRTKTQQIFGNLGRAKCIVAHNKPQAVLLSIKEYEQLIQKKEQRKTVVDFWEDGVNVKELLACHID